MPRMDGFELAQIISQKPSKKPTWLIAITADALEGAAEKCMSAGFNDYMAKPCLQEDINNRNITTIFLNKFFFFVCPRM